MMDTMELVEKEEKKGWFARLKAGLSKSSNKLTDGISGIFTKRKLDDETLEELEELLITSDLGVEVARSITTDLAKDRFNKEISLEEVKEVMAKNISELLTPYATPLTIDATLKPQVILICGVNGNGKTTTIGKLAKQYKEQGHSVMIAACDTFRAAAVSQLAVWAERAGCEIIEGEMNADPASVAYKALERAKAAGTDVVLIDTAGRLHNKSNLMDELAKVIRVMQKVIPEAPHHTVLVLDATTGQNAHAQVDVFKKCVNLTGLIVTKLDGTAKGGVVVALAKQFGLPIHAIGVGEGIDDLKAFEADSFAKSLVG